MLLRYMSHKVLYRQLQILLSHRPGSEANNTGHANVVNVFLQKCDEYLKRRTEDSVNAQLAVDLLYEILQRLEIILPHSVRHNCRVRFLRFAQATSKLPSSFRLGHVQVLNECPIGVGASAVVYRGVVSNKDVAVKQFRLNIKKLHYIRKMFIKEACILQSLLHPNILPFCGVIYSSNECSIVTPLMRYGTIRSYVAQYPDACKRDLLATGLRYLKSRHIVHGDIKGGNILVDDNGCIRISDFGVASYDLESASDVSVTGVSRLSHACSSTYSNGGTLRWMSPERLGSETRSEKATFASDVYSFGMVIYEIYSGRIPFHDIHDMKAVLEIVGNGRPIRDFEIPDDLWKLTAECWAANPLRRPRIEDIVAQLSMATSEN